MSHGNPQQDSGVPLGGPLTSGPCKVYWRLCNELAMAALLGSPISAEAFSPLSAVQLILNTAAAFWQVFVTFCHPLPTGVAGLHQKISRDLHGIDDKVYLSGPFAFFRCFHEQIVRLRTMASSSIRMRVGANRRLTVLGESLHIRVGTGVQQK